MLVHTSMGCMAILVQTSMGYMAIFLPSNSKYLFILVIADPYWGMAVKKYNSNQYKINIYLMPDPERASQAERITLTKLSKETTRNDLRSGLRAAPKRSHCLEQDLTWDH